MRPNNAGRDMWLEAQTTNQNVKHNPQTQDADVIWELFVLYMTRLEDLSQQYYI